VLLRKWAVELDASVNVATAVLPLENVMLIGPKSAALIVAPEGYSIWLSTKW
jgi:hypothetical protein